MCSISVRSSSREMISRSYRNPSGYFGGSVKKSICPCAIARHCPAMTLFSSRSLSVDVEVVTGERKHIVRRNCCRLRNLRGMGGERIVREGTENSRARAWPQRGPHQGLPNHEPEPVGAAAPRLL